MAESKETFKVRVISTLYCSDRFRLFEILTVTEWNEYWWNTEDRGIIRKANCKEWPTPAPRWPVDPGLRWWHVKRYILATIIAISFSQLHAQDSGAFKLDTGALRDTMYSHTMGFVYYDSSRQIATYDYDGDKKWTITDTMALIKWFYQNIQYQYKTQEWYQQHIDLLYKLLKLTDAVIHGDQKALVKYRKIASQILYLQHHPPK